MMPRIEIRIAITAAKIGRSMKKCGKRNLIPPVRRPWDDGGFGVGPASSVTGSTRAGRRRLGGRWRDIGWRRRRGVRRARLQPDDMWLDHRVRAQGRKAG